ncbi:Gfo Idh MocA family oxidoreductase [Liquorilactobacillus aquaticus DSM 21051]|uniref:Gfo Idh MocA family oxidoreductase n=1 Tax=Liquorilactobacillus aquaticus DSM 21051 TaxID=1423725 RepID=A0A0R2CUX8_9LACO|nr:Gfo/Idh/MocA family oxidoreductase [Liquorilactobacillus aquaticus]KRM95597.1 Gfo Idh MocA family oxidoreductase [Liquorilactobacillus aquaticus DSM 21051]
MADKIRYGIIGATSQAAKFARALSLSSSSELVGIADADQTLSKKFATEMVVPKAYEDYSQLCRSVGIDIVYIPVKNKERYDCAKMALENGKNVLLERPFTRHKVGASELFHLAAKKKLFIMEAQSALFLPIMQKVKKMLEDGVIGEVKFVDVKEKHAIDDRSEWFSKLAAGGGAFFNGGSNLLGVIQFLLNDSIKEWSGFEYNQVGEADTRCAISLKCGDVLVNSLITTDFDIESKLVIYGTKGKIKIPNYWEGSAAVLENKLGTKRFVLENQENELIYEIDHVAKCLTSGVMVSPIATPELTMQTMNIIQSLYQKWYGDPLN